MGKGAPKNQTVSSSSTTSLPPWLEPYASDAVSRAGDLSNEKYQAYGGDTVAGLTDDQQQSFALARGLAGDAMGRLSVESNLNPYLAEVERTGIQNLQDTAQQQRGVIASNAKAAGAFGGDRQGVAEGVLAAQTAKDAGALSAGLRSQGFTQAQQAAAQAFAQAGGAQGLLGQAGATQQTQQQNELADAYGRWAEEQGWDENRLGLLISAISGVPYGTSTESTTTRPLSSNKGANIMGGAGLGLSLASLIPGVGPFAALGMAAGGGLLGGMSG